MKRNEEIERSRWLPSHEPCYPFDPVEWFADEVEGESVAEIMEPVENVRSVERVAGVPCVGGPGAVDSRKLPAV